MSEYLPTATVVVAVYNGERTIDECVESLLALDYPRDLLEILLVDNGSRDRTRSILERFGDAIRVLHESERGPAAARNAGIVEARGDVVAFTDADCIVEPGWLRGLVEPLADRGVGIVGGTILARRPANGAELFGEWIHDHANAIQEARAPYAITMSWASRRAALLEVGLFDSALKRSSDHELAWRISQAGYSIVFAADAVVYHRNERSLAGLFREGWQHGFYGRRVARRHAGHLRRRRMQLDLSRAFRLGKRIGSGVGRVWFSIRGDPRAGSAALPTSAPQPATTNELSSTSTLPHVSVVLAASNAGPTIRECVESLLALDYPRELFEVLVVDDASSDGTRAMLERFGAAIRVVHESGRTQADARNAGVREARGDVIAFTEADCTVHPRWLRELVTPLDDPAVGIAGGAIYLRTRSDAAPSHGRQIRDHKFALCKATPPYAETASWASRRDVLLGTGLFDPTLKRSWGVELAYRIGRAGYTLVFVPDAAVYQLDERSRGHRLREGVRHGFWGVAVARRHRSYYQRSQARELAFRSRYGRALRLGKWVGRRTAAVALAVSGVWRRVSDMLGRSRALATESEDAES